MAFMVQRTLALPLSALALCAAALIMSPPALLPSWTALLGFAMVTSIIMVAMRRLRTERPSANK